MAEAFPAAIDVEELAQLREGREPHAVLDIREPWEIEICAIEGAITIPMGALPGRLNELPGDRMLVVLCHHGMRSAQATAWLRRAGYDNAVNLRGGIDAWARQIDPALATY